MLEHRPDLAVLDVKMPRLDGISAAEQIAAARAAPVVMLTAFSQRELVERARAAGAMAYLVKPFTKADLVPAIEMAMARYDELTTLEREVSDLRERLETRKLVDRAKGALQDRHGLDEAAALPVDPAHLDGPPDDDARGRRAGGCRAATTPTVRTRPSLTDVPVVRYRCVTAAPARRRQVTTWQRRRV